MKQVKFSQMKDGDKEDYDLLSNLEDTINFCYKRDQASFDPNYKTMPLEEFIPMVGRIFNREPYKNY